MQRRGFIKSAVGGIVGSFFYKKGFSNMNANAELRKESKYSDYPDDIKITRIVSFNLTSHRIKLVGNNAVGGVHGTAAKERMVRIYTNSGIEGIGRCYKPEHVLVSLLGRNPFDYYQAEQKRIQSSLSVHTMPMWDLIGKALNKPVYALLGGSGFEQVPTYDGSIYFSDLMKEYTSNYSDRFRQEIDLGLEHGFRAFKVKVGRGYKWMDRKAGDARDIEVLKIIRNHAGKDIQIGIDANDGHTLASTKRLLESLPDFDFAFVEEMFPEEIHQYLELKEFIAEHGFNTYIAEGESQSSPVGLKPFIDARAIDILQGDMNAYGTEGILLEAEWAQSQNLKVAPHNWGSLLGYYQQLHIGKAIPNFYMAECDPLQSDVLIAQGYKREDGYATVPDSSGFGLGLDETKFSSSSDVEILFDLN